MDGPWTLFQPSSDSAPDAPTDSTAPSAAPSPSPSGSTPAPWTLFAPSGSSTSPETSASTGDAAPPLTVHVGRQAPVTAAPPPGASSDVVGVGQAAPVPGGMSYEDAATPPTPNPGGVLSNAPGDDYTSGGLKGLGTTVIKGLSHIPGVFGDAMDMADYLAARAQAKIQGRPADDVLKEWQDAKAASANDSSWTRYLDPANLLPSGQTLAAPVLAQTGEYAPTSEPGKIAMAAGEAAIGGFLPGGGLRSILPNVLAGGVGQAATDLTQDPLYGLAAGLVAAPAAELAGKTAYKAAMPIVAATPGLRNTALANTWADNAAAAKTASSFTTPQAAQDWAAQPPAPDLVPGSPNTLAATVGNDPRLFQAEKAARSVDNTAFNAIDAAKSQAQFGALGSIQPDADVFSPGQMLGARMDAIDAAAQAAEDRLNAAHQDAVTSTTASGQAFADQQKGDLAQRTADRTQAAADARTQGAAQRQAAHEGLVQAFQDAQGRQLGTAQEAAADLGGKADLNDQGAILRGAVEEVRAGAKDLHRKLYRVVDPDGTLALVATPLRDAATRIVDGVKADGSELDPSEAGLFRRAQNLPDVASYRVIHALDRDVSAAMSKERQSAGETPTWARLSQLKGAVKNAMLKATDNQMAHEARLVAAGQIEPADTIEDRIGTVWAEHFNDLASDASGNLARTGTTPVGVSGARATGNFGSTRTTSAARGGYGPPPSDPRVPEEAPLLDESAVTTRPLRPTVPRPQMLEDFIRSHGGIQDAGGDLKSMGMNNLIARPGQGLSADRMREAAAEAGYLGADTDHAVSNTDVNDLYDRLGEGTYSVHDQDAAHAWEGYDAQRAEYDRVSGPTSRSAAPPRAPTSAYRQEDAYPPGLAPSDQPQAANDSLKPNFDKGGNERLKAANAAYAEYARTYKNPIVGPGLKTTGYSGQYARTNSAFIKAAIRPGPEGYENARAYLTAARNDPAAIGAMHEAALNPLRKTVTGNGTITPTGLARWKESYGGALRALNEVSPGFSSRFDSAADATQALVDVGLQHRQRLEEHQAQAALDAIQEKADVTSGLKDANAADKATVARSLTDRATADQAAIASSKADTSAGIAQARGMVRDAKASPAGQFAKVASGAIAPTEVENTVGSLLQTGKSGAARMRGLAQSVADNPDALAGLQRAGAGWMAREFQGGANGLLHADRFIKFLRNNRDVLSELYPTQTVNMMGALARDAEIGAKWYTQTAIKGGSDSVKNLIAFMQDKKVEHLSLGMVAVEAVSQGYDHGGLRGAAVGGAGAAAAYLVNSLRSAGIKRVSDLYRDALADPELARTLLAKMPTSPDSGVLYTLARIMKRSLIVGPIVERKEPKPQSRPTIQAVKPKPPTLPASAGALSGFGYVPDTRMQGRFVRASP